MNGLNESRNFIVHGLANFLGGAAFWRDAQLKRAGRRWPERAVSLFSRWLVLMLCVGLQELDAANIDVNKPVQRLATPDQVRDAFRRGLFVQVTEGASILVAADPKSPIKGPLGVSLATLGALDKAGPLITEAESAKEPQASLHRLHFEAMKAQKEGKIDAMTNACFRAIREDFRHPVAYFLLARLSLEQKEFAKAEKYAGEALAFEPKMAPAQFLLGISRHAQNKREEAARDLGNAIQLDPIDARPRMALGSLYAEVGAHAQAVSVFRDVVNLNSGLVPARERLSLSLLESGNEQEAISTASETLKQHPQSTQSRYVLALAHFRTGKLDETEAELRKYGEAMPNAVEGHYLSALVRALKNQFREAVGALEKSLQVAPGQPGVLGAIGTMHHLAGDLNAATNAFHQALRGANPSMADRIHFQLGLVALDRKDWKGAHEWFQKTAKFVSNFRSDLLDYRSLYEQAPEKSLGQTSFGSLLLADRMVQSSIDTFRQGLKRNERDAVGLLLGGSASARKGDTSQALEWLNKLATLQPQYWPAHYALADIHLTRKDLEKSEASFRRTVQLDPLNEASYLRLLAIYRDRGNLEKAESTAREMVAKMPASPTGYNELAAFLAERKDRLDEALTLAKKALGMESQNGYFLDTLGWVHYQRGEYVEAEKILENAAKVLPRHAEVRLHLGQALFKNKKLDQSAGHLREVITLAPGTSFAKEAEALLPKTSSISSKP